MVIVPREEQSGNELIGDACNDQDETESGEAMMPESDDYGTQAAKTEDRSLRRSRRLKGETPERFLAAMGHNLLPRPWNDPCPIPGAAYSLHCGALPLLVPSWIPDMLQESYEDYETPKG